MEQTNNIFPEIYQYNPDVMIVDCRFNGINGGEICHHIKTNDQTSRITVIIVSAYPKLLKLLGYYGCDDFIPKPFDLHDVTGRIQKLIDRAANQQLYVI
ncbi:two-component system response regulator [Mucilaginibacter sp. AW1-3]